MRGLKFVVCLLFLCLGAGAFFLQPQKGSAKSQSLLAAPDAPTGVAASDTDYADKVMINWHTMQHATLYRVFRNTANNSATATDVGTTAANYFFDTSGAGGQTYYYWVRAENSSGVSSLGTPDTGARSNTEIQSSEFPPLDPPTAPDLNQVTAAKAYLGKTLFWDEQLSSTRTVACGTCHRPSEGGSDPRTSTTDQLTANPGPDNAYGTADDIFGSPGVIQNDSNGIYSFNAQFGLNPQVTNRKAPSYLNAGYAHSGLFWDGRASIQFRDQLTNELLLDGFASLESQTAGPPVSPGEMGHTGRDWSNVATRIQGVRPLALAHDIPSGLKAWVGDRTYADLFAEAFGSPGITPSRISMAIATHERTLFSDRTPLDKAAAGIAPLTEEEQRGKDLFTGLNCSACHAGSLLSDQSFHNIAVRPASDDIGRAAVSGNSDDNARFKTPTLRNVSLHGPYMHNGRFATLEDVVEFYNRGGDFDAVNVDHSLIRPLNMLPQEKADLVAFMKRPLVDPRVASELPPFDRPKLFTESANVPVVATSGGRAGSGGSVPKPIAVSPPLIGNPAFIAGVSSGRGGGAATLVIGDADPGVGTSIPASGSFAYRQITLSGAGVSDGYGSVSIAIPNDNSLVGRTFYGRWYIVDAGSVNGFSVSRLFSFTIFASEISPVQQRTAHVDFDGDGKTDVSVFRGAEQGWYINNSSGTAPTLVGFGFATDKVAVADFDGDHKADITVFRDGNWYSLLSGSTFSAVAFGSPGDIPQPGDWDGDGKADQAVFRPSTGTWYILQSRDGFRAIGFGQNGDKPMAGDYDGDGKTDAAVFRSGIWHVFQSSAGYTGLQFGLPDDKPVPGDYDGDGKTDVAVWRPSNGVWYGFRSTDHGIYAAQFGISTDSPAPGDYDGDGKWDPAVLRNGTWYMLRSTAGFGVAGWGLAGDLPIPGAYAVN